MKTLDAIRCPKCKNPLRSNRINKGFDRCPYCHKKVRIDVFPVIFEQVNSTLNTVQTQEGEAYCSTHGHENWPATFSCEACGRFICDLCHVTVGEQTVCTNCLISKPKGDTSWDFDKKRPLHCRTAAIWLFGGSFLFFLFFGQVMATIYAIKALKQKPPLYKSTNTFERVCAGLILLLTIGSTVGGALFWGNIFDS